MRGILPFFIVLLAVAFFTRVDFFFYLLYALFGIYVLGRFWARRSLTSVALERQHDRRVFLGQSFTVDVEARNRGWLPVLWMRLSDTIPADLSPGPSFRRVISLLPRERLKMSYTLSGRRRGYYPLGPFATLGGDLLGMATYQNSHGDQDFVIVYPKIVALRELGFPSQSPFGPLPSRERIFEDPTRIQGVRDYQPGDSLRRMDWKTSARVGRLQVRRYEPAIALETAIFLNLCDSDYAQAAVQPLAPRAHGGPGLTSQATELGIVIAASVAVHMVQKRQAVSLVTNGRDPLALNPSAISYLPLRKGREHLMHLLDLLARIETSSGDDDTTELLPEGGASGDRPMAFLDLLTHKSQGLPWGSTVVVITAREVEGLLDTLLMLRRRGVAVILVLTSAGREFDLTVQRADQIGIRALGIWSEQDLDVWR
jgi:uncharacterized protein (DUF58 family)